MIKYSDKIKCNIILPIHLFFLIDDVTEGSKHHPLFIKIANSRLLTTLASKYILSFPMPWSVNLLSNLQYQPLQESVILCLFTDTRYLSNDTYSQTIPSP